mgnify:CR=1 FL=1
MRYKKLFKKKKGYLDLTTGKTVRKIIRKNRNTRRKIAYGKEMNSM